MRRHSKEIKPSSQDFLEMDACLLADLAAARERISKYRR
jgi:hypothetical protein